MKVWPIVLAAALLVGLMMFAAAPDRGPHLCDPAKVDAIFHDPHFLVTGFRQDIATGCLVEIHGEFR